MYKKITTMLLVVCLIFIAYTLYEDYVEAKEQLYLEINEFNRAQYDVWYALQRAEIYLLKYPIDGIDSEEQKDLAKALNKDMNQIEGQMMYRRLPFATFTYEKGIKEIFRELDIYVNDFDTQRYPANEENLTYMNNLLILIQELRMSFDNHIGLLEMAVQRQDTGYVNQFMEIQTPIFDKNTWAIEGVYMNPEEAVFDLEDEEQNAKDLPIEEFKALAHEFYKIDHPDVQLEQLKMLGHGGSNVMGNYIQDIRYGHDDFSIQFWEDGSLKSIEYEKNYRDYEEDGMLEMLTDIDIEHMVSLADQYLEVHGIEGYEVSDLGEVNLGRLWIEYQEAGKIKNSMKSIYVRVVKTDEYYISFLNMPNPVYAEAEDGRLDEAKATFETFEEKISKEYDIVNSWLQITGMDDLGLIYQWVFLVEKGNAQYELIYDAFGEE